MYTHAPHFVRLYRSEGEVKDSDYDARGIPKLPDEDYIIRDEQVLWRQRPVLITCENTVARFVDYEQQRLDRLNPVLVAIEKDKKTEDRRVAKEFKKAQTFVAAQEKKIIKKIADTEAKQMEVARREGLSTEQRKHEDTVKKENKKRKKEEGIAANAAKVAKCTRILNPGLE